MWSFFKGNEQHLKMTKNRDKSLSGEQDRERWECCQSTAKRIYKQPRSQTQRRHLTPNIGMQITSNKRKLGKRDGPEERLRSPGTAHMDKNSYRQKEYSRQEEDIWYNNRSTFPTLCPFAGSSTPQHSEAQKPQLQSDGLGQTVQRKMALGIGMETSGL